MALIAVLTVVDIAADTLVFLVGLRLQVATRAREHRIVVRVRVAIAANAVGVAVVHREPGVIELRVGPDLGVVAGLARRREMRGDVVRIVRVQVILLMAAVAIRWQIRPVVVYVAIGALARWNGVRPGQRELSFAVIELGVGPGDRVVAELASLRETHLRVRGIVRVVVILQVTRDARRLIQLVIIVDVAIAAGARRNGVRSGQRPARL